MDVGEGLAAQQLSASAKELPIRRTVVEPSPFEIEDRNVLADTLRNQAEELALLAQAGFQRLALGNVLGGADAAQRLAGVVELDLGALCDPALRCTDHDAQLDGEGLPCQG